VKANGNGEGEDAGLKPGRYIGKFNVGRVVVTDTIDSAAR